MSRRPEYLFIDQGTPEWFRVRAGIPTASEFGTVLAQGKEADGSKTSKASATRRKYLYQLAGEILTGEPTESYSNFHMKRGQEREPEGRALYTLRTGNELVRVGFVRHNGWGASPDSLVGDDGLYEGKDALAHIQIERLLAKCCPAEHVPQVQGQLLVTGRRWCDFMSHCRGLPPLIVRVERDEAYIKRLRKELKAFCTELNALVEQIRNYD